MTRSLRRWHKRCGVMAAVFFVFLAVTGMLLNHGQELSLDRERVGTPWLMAWYGLRPTTPERGFQQDDWLFAWQGETWVLAGKTVPPAHGEPIGAVGAAGQLWVASNEAVHIYRPDGQLVDKIERDVLPSVPLRRFGKFHDQVVVDTRAGIFASADGIESIPLPATNAVDWAQLRRLSPEQRQRLAPLFLPALPAQRVLADLHSGRIFGRYGVLAMDGAAIALLILVVSGLLMHTHWWRRRRHLHAEHHRPPASVAEPSSLEPPPQTPLLAQSVEHRNHS